MIHFCIRYTETDSRPLTPAPTLASAHTRASGSRRCVTPDPTPTAEIREKTLLILDLRRSHSQETLTWYGSTNLVHQDPPLIRIQRAPTRRLISPVTTLSCSRVLDCSKRNTEKLNGNSPRRPKSYEKTGVSFKMYLSIFCFSIWCVFLVGICKRTIKKQTKAGWSCWRWGWGFYQKERKTAKETRKGFVWW